MRAIIAFEARGGPESVEAVLRANDWHVPSPADGKSWPGLIDRLPPVGAYDAQRNALELQTQAEHELIRAGSQDLDDQLLEAIHDVQSKQNTATQAQRLAIESERLLLRQVAPDFMADGQPRKGAEHRSFDELAAAEAQLILGQMAPEDRDYALITFKSPIYDRRTQTWGTLHYEDRLDASTNSSAGAELTDHQGQANADRSRHVVIRLRNSHSERLKRASQRLVGHLLGDIEGESRTARLRRVAGELGRILQTLWYKSALRPAYEFEPIKVLEPGSPREAFFGTVVTERTLSSVVRVRRGELRIALIFFVLGALVLLLESPLVFNYDLRVHDLKVWHDGWLSWVSGNLGRLGSSLFVAAFLPVVQVLLHWREVRRRPAIEWNLD